MGVFDSHSAELYVLSETVRRLDLRLKEMSRRIDEITNGVECLTRDLEGASERINETVRSAIHDYESTICSELRAVGQIFDQIFRRQSAMLDAQSQQLAKLQEELIGIERRLTLAISGPRLPRPIAGNKRQSLYSIDHVRPHSGYCFSAVLVGSQGDSELEPTRSPLRLFEDGVSLGPPHTLHAEIATKGGGRYSHWGEVLYFSSSDNSDPRDNERIYHVQLGEFDGINCQIARAIEPLRALPSNYSSSAAYAAIERALAALDPVPVLGDTHKAYWQNATFVREFARVVGNDRRTMERKYTVYQIMKSLYWLPGDVAECGTWNGGSAYFIALAGREIKRERPLHIFDSFQGLSQPTDDDGSFWKAGDLSISIEAVKSILAGFEDVHLYPGWIPSEFHHVADRRFCLVHIDVDLHDPTLESLAFFYPRMVAGGIIICDDYGSALCPGARKAIDTYLSDKPERIIDLPTMQGLIIKLPFEET